MSSKFSGQEFEEMHRTIGSLKTPKASADSSKHDVVTKGGVEDIRLKAKTKDTNKFSRPRTDPLEAKAKDPRSQTQVFFKKIGLQIFFQAISKRGKQKKVFANLPRGFWRFPTKL